MATAIEVKNPLTYDSQGRYKCTGAVLIWFWRNIPFTAHKLRHACNIRMHQMGLNPLAIANSLGHTIQMNQSTYLRYQGTESKVKGIKQALNQYESKQTEAEKLKSENARLIEEIKYLRERNAHLETELRLYKVMSSQSGV